MANEEERPSKRSEEEMSWEERNPEIVKEIPIDEYRPIGTLTIALLYFLIVVLMWIFMYFVEFAGNDPSILG